MKRESRLRQKPASRPSQSGFGAQFMPISNAEKFKLGHYREPPEVDRNRFLAQSVCGVLMPLAPSPMKKGLFIIFAVVLCRAWLRTRNGSTRATTAANLWSAKRLTATINSDKQRRATLARSPETSS